MKWSLYLIVFAGLLVNGNLNAQQTPSPVDAFLKFDAESKECAAKAGDPQANFTFCVTNTSTTNVVVSNVATSCGCTAAKVPPLPWTIAPGAGGEIGATMNILGKQGTVVKTLTVTTDQGQKVLYVRANIPVPAPAAPAEAGMGNRSENQKIAIADRQAVFKGDCAKCHVEKSVGKMGKELYADSCGICHEAEHRASMVPNLHALVQPTNAEYWKNWITHGKPGSLMPAFAKAEGGPLTDEQINSLVEYLSGAIPSKPTAHAAVPPPPVH